MAGQFFLSDFLWGARYNIRLSFTWQMEFLFYNNSAARFRAAPSRYSSPTQHRRFLYCKYIKGRNCSMGAWGCSPLKLPSAYPPHVAYEVPFTNILQICTCLPLAAISTHKKFLSGGILRRLRHSNRILLASFKEA